MKGKFEKIAKSLPDGIDALLLTSEINQYYATGFQFTDGYVLVTREKTYILCDFRYIEAAQSCPGVEKIELGEGVLKQTLNSFGVQKLGFEDTDLTVYSKASLEKRLEGITLIPVGDFLNSLRQLKDKDEIEIIKRAQDITDKAFAYIVGILDPKMTECDVALELEFFMRKNGAQGLAFDTICVSGTSSSLPHGEPANVPLRRGFLTMDFGAKVDGYCSDMTRTVVIGKADEEMKKLYNTVLSAQVAALDYAKAGVTCAEADSVAREIIEKDYPATFGHSLGHGVGLYIHEQPALSKKSAGVLKKGHVVTVEPGIYIAGKYGCRIEDMIYIDDSKTENLTHSVKDLIEIY